jgi:chemotaxis regulatin CheY-phosphate phosphatase CheZ
VNRATESATVEILNTLDRIDQRLSQTGETLGALRSAWDRRNEPQTSIHDTLTAIEQAVQETRQDSISIAMALQVQDITSQQIAGVSHLMDSVRARLEELFRESETPPAAQGPAPVPPTFDGNAAYTTSGERQNQADDIVQQWHKGAS